MITLCVKESATGRQIRGSRDVYESIKEIAKADQETFWVIGYNGNNKEILRKCLFMGSIEIALIDPRIIFNRLLLKGAVSWIAVHNHPSGEIRPSHNDLIITKQLREESAVLGLTMLDHLIIGDGGYYSFVDNSWAGATI